MTSAGNLYESVINDVITSVRDSFLDEQIDESVLQELKTLWHTKLHASGTIGLSGAAAAAVDVKPPIRPSATSAGPSRHAASSAAPAANGATSASSNQIVITDPNRLVPVQITIPAQPGNPASQPRSLTVEVPAHALQSTGSTSGVLQQVLTQAITQALVLPESHAAAFLQTQINNAFRLS